MTLTGPYVERGAVIVPGKVAAIYDRVLSAPKVAAVLLALGDADEQAVREAMRRAAKAYDQARATQRNGETVDGSGGAPWPHEITTDQAARMLGVTRRRAQQLAAGGLGRRDQAGRWRLDAAAVTALAELRTRRAS
jgi:hypothetical protein